MCRIEKCTETLFSDKGQADRQDTVTRQFDDQGVSMTTTTMTINLTYSNVHTLKICPHICIILLTRWARCNHDNSHCPTDSIPSIHPCACVCGAGHQSLTHHTYTQTRLGPWVQDAKLRQFMSLQISEDLARAMKHSTLSNSLKIGWVRSTLLNF